MFLLSYVLIALLFFALGCCLLVSPGAYFALLDRVAGVDLWAKRGPGWDPNARRWRVAGVAVIAFAIFMVVGPPLSAYLRSPEEFNLLFHASHHATSWGAVVIFVLFFVLGVGFLGKPLILLDKFTPRKLSADSEVHRRAYLLRIFGGVLLLVSLLGISIQLLRYLRR